MYELKEEQCGAVKMDRKEDFRQTVYAELMSFNLEEQNLILRDLYERVKEERKHKLSDLKKEAEYIDQSLSQLG